MAWNAADYGTHAAFVPALGAPVLALLAPRPGERILDLGCGDGVLTAQLVEAGAEVLGLDPDPSMLAAARALGLTVHQGDGQALAFEAEFDAVFSNAALHWMPDHDAVLAGVFAALKPGGRFVGECGGHGNIAAIRTAIRAVSMARGEAADEEQNYPTASAHAARLAAAGFTDIQAEIIPRPTPLPTGMVAWLNTFRAGFVRHAADRDAAVADVEALLKPALCDADGKWTADYVRLRWQARKPKD
ncbi:class I SAM-dependent methyltransferase [Sandaracinobacteroides saxicola]|uniref:Class I SAM-dependent methyltransferase n=1 Tax=Sandaracinobacteroides saxicola TaxID=2759707 RepID=A0A7G5IKY5_9SPHN|nr:class I SAM-dependent methyltransferase [Sandaracinobacteroides saxicola]QMW24027.1 class I SAM-dependent methyltransferase [Sandaracinobacteroides saxicola]